MSLLLGPCVQSVVWKEANVTLDMVPLAEDVNERFVKETTKARRDEQDKIVGLDRDSARYAELVGQHCIKGWHGVVDEKGKPVPFSEEAVARAMRIGPFQAFVFARVRGLELWLNKETEAAGNA